MGFNIAKIKGNREIGRHRHTGGNVIGYNIQGQWRYKERNWVAKPGSFVFEPPGDIHTLVTEGEEDVITLFILGGTLQFFDEDNNIIAQDDVFTIYCRTAPLAPLTGRGLRKIEANSFPRGWYCCQCRITI